MLESVMRYRTASLLAVVLLLPCGDMRADDLPDLQLAEGWSDFFGGQEVVLHVIGASSPDVRISWSLEAGGRPVVKRESTSPELRVPLPPAKEGIVLTATLRAQAMNARGEPVAKELERTIHIYHENAFADKSEWLRGLGIRLFDPAGKTAEAFEKAGIPFRRVRSPDAVELDAKTLVVIGEGVSFDEYKGLSDLLSQWLNAGTSVLCLAPADGGFPLPGCAEGESAPDSLLLQRTEFVRALDKALDAEAWPPSGHSQSRCMVIGSVRGDVRLSFESEANGWSWLSAGKAHGRLAICMLDIIASWDSTPAPRYLLLKMLEQIDKEGSEHEAKR